MSGKVPENSLAAMRAAADLGMSWVEMDVRASLEGHPVMLHDSGLRRTTNSRGRVRRKALDQLRTVTLDDGSAVPLLDEALALASELNLGLVLDLKNAADLDLKHLSELLNQHSQRVIVGVRSLTTMRQLRGLSPSVRILGFASSKNEIQQFVANGVGAVRLWPHRVRSDPELLAFLRSAQVEIWVTTGRLQGRKMARLLELGIDAVITDVPSALLDEACCC